MYNLLDFPMGTYKQTDSNMEQEYYITIGFLACLYWYRGKIKADGPLKLLPYAHDKSRGHMEMRWLTLN